MKRWFCVALALCLALSLAACGSEKEPPSSDPESSLATPAPPTPAPMAWVMVSDADDGLNVRSQPSTEGEKGVLCFLSCSPMNHPAELSVTGRSSLFVQKKYMFICIVFESILLVFLSKCMTH